MKTKLQFIILALTWLAQPACPALHAADCAPPPAGLVAWWRAEGNGNDSAGTNHGLHSEIFFAPGKVGNAFTFNGLGTDSLKVPDSDSLNPTSGISLEAWIHTTGTPNYAGILFNMDQNGPPTGYTLSMNTGGSIRADFGNGSTTITAANTNIVTDGNWHHLVATYDGAGAFLYLDGVPGNPAYGVGYLTPRPSGAILLIGRDDYQFNYNRSFQGEIDEPSVYNRALTANEVLALFNAGSAGKCQQSMESMDWFKMAGGGGASSNGTGRLLLGTIGQPDASGPLTNSQFSLVGGFWALPVAVQIPGAPTLTIVPAAPGQATISWMPNTPGFVLQETLSLSPANWFNSPSGATNPIVVPATLPTKFYRLSKP